MFRTGTNPKEEPAKPSGTPPPPQPLQSRPGVTPQPPQPPQPEPPAGTNPQPASASQGQVRSSTMPATSESEALARDIKDGTLKGYIGNGTELTGEVNFKGMLRVDGHLSGNVNSQDGTLIVSTGGVVSANVFVSIAQVYGTVEGDISASKKIEMGRASRVTGNIQTPALVIEQGALFEGHCAMSQQKDGAGQASQDKRAAEQPSTSSRFGSSSRGLKKAES